MPETLRALVLGSGFAGQGHTDALRDAGVEVVGMASRTKEVVERIAAEMSIPYATTDWNQALEDLKPDIVAVGTPGGAHLEPVSAAIDRGCHVYCDKPLTTAAPDAKKLYLQAKDAGVKTAFAASFRYQPYVLLAKSLIAEGKIGDPLEIEFISHPNLNPLIPFGWSHRIDLGGGRLGNNFSHKLSIALHATNGTLLDARGQARYDMKKAPIVEGVHDFRERGNFAPDPSAAQGLEWESVDSEWSYTVMARIAPSGDQSKPVSVLFKHGGLQPRFDDDYVAFYGMDAAIHISGVYAQGPFHLCQRNGKWEELSIPKSITDELPNIQSDSVRNWAQLAREFVADIQGKGYSGYQTFKDGWIFQEVFDAVRAETEWTAIPQE